MQDTIESQRVGKLVRAKAGQCYLNAYRVIQYVPGYADADYVEGMAVFGLAAIQHGWVEKDGVIVDPTLPLKPAVYFPGLRFKGELGLSLALQRLETAELPFFYQLGPDGIDSPEFRAAAIAAYRFAAKQYEDYEPLYVTEVLPNGERALVIR
jgi:hypothetical protein